MSNEIHIRDCDNGNLWGFDPYERQTRGRLAVELVIDPRARKAWVAPYYPGDHASGPDEYFHRILTIRVRAAAGDGEVDGERLTALLRDEGSREHALLERIMRGHRVEWNGNEHVGLLSDDAQAALDELEAALSDVPGTGREFWNADDYYLSANSLRGACAIVGITPDTGDDAIESMLDPQVDEALRSGVHLDRDDLRSALRSMRDRLADLRSDAA